MSKLVTLICIYVLDHLSHNAHNCLSFGLKYFMPSVWLSLDFFFLSGCVSVCKALPVVAIYQELW